MTAEKENEQRCIRSIEKAEEMLENVKARKLDSKEKHLVEKAGHYIKDAKYFLQKKDYISSFGASDYAFGILEAVSELCP